jgi:NADPH:quinone reductase-like Zn-dependent oxidoreductase
MLLVCTGTLQEYATFAASEVEECPVHLSTPEAAALPLCGTTAYRAIFNKGQIKAGQNVLITGIGGGVALAALQFACAAGATVFVTSSSAEKIRSAKELGASAGVSYKSPEWEKDLQKLLPKSRPYLDLVVDGAGGDIVQRSVSLLKKGGIIVSYGMTLGPLVPFTMTAVLKNIEVCGILKLPDYGSVLTLNNSFAERQWAHGKSFMIWCGFPFHFHFRSCPSHVQVA